MAFLTKTDFRFSISITVLNSLTGNDDTIIDEIAAEAVEEMKSYLSLRYDTNLIFAATGINRNKSVMMYCKDIALYHIYSISTATVIPEQRVNRYKKAISWLEEVNEQSINPEGLPLNSNSMVQTGGNEKRINHQQ
jgi:phage gp36-like protein